MPSSIRKPLVVLALAAAVPVFLMCSGCGGGGGLSGSQSTPAGSTISIPAQAVKVLDSAGKPVGRSLSTAALTVQPGQAFSLAVSIDDCTGVAGLTVKISYGAALSCVDVANGNTVSDSSSPLIVKSVHDGQHTATVTVAGSAGASGGRSTLATFSMVAKPGATAGGAGVTVSGDIADSSGMSLGSTERIVAATQAMMSPMQAATAGDLLGTGKAEVGSAIKILRVVATVDTAPTDISQWDCNGNGAIDVGDAIRVMRSVVGKDAWPIVVPTTATVPGTVIDSATLSPLSGAVATIGSLSSSATGTNGKFAIRLVPKGLQTLTVSKTGYTSASMTNVNVVPMSIDVGTVPLVVIGPPPTGSVSGTVYQADGSTVVPNVAVSAGGVTGHTDSLGRFTITGVPVGRQLVMATVITGGETYTAAAWATVVANQLTSGLRLVAADGPPPPPI
jgi:hypothetical protein